jgi:hypothetical protein
MLGAKKIADSEELVLNVVAAITNLLFYDVPSNLLFQEENKQLLCHLSRPLLLESYNVEALIETARALGNLSRHADARQHMGNLRLDEVLVILLDHDDRDLVFYVCGALVNLAADPECTSRLTSVCPLVQKLAKLIGDAMHEKETSLQLVAVKVLTNLSLDPGVTWPVTGMEDVREALERVVAAAGLAESSEATSEVEQLLELSQHFLGRLPPVDPASPAKAAGTNATGPPANAGAEVCPPVGSSTGNTAFVCPAPGCGRTFPSQTKLQAHTDRRHPELKL